MISIVRCRACQMRTVFRRSLLDIMSKVPPL